MTSLFFVLIADGNEPWIVYHAMAEPNAGWIGRTARAQKFEWNPDMSPNFGRPRGFDISLDSPSTAARSWLTPKPITTIILLYTAIQLNS